MISLVRRQTADVRSDILRRVSTLGLVGSCGPVAGRSSILETNRGGQSIWINRAVERGLKARDQACRIGYRYRRPVGLSVVTFTTLELPLVLAPLYAQTR